MGQERRKSKRRDPVSYTHLLTTRRSISRIVAVTRGRGCSAAGARFLRTEEAGGSIPPSSTRTKRLSGYFEACSGRSAAWLAHLLWEQGVEGSNPFAPTIRNPEGFRGNSSVGRATAFQAVGRGFESRFPLQFTKSGNLRL